jgi:PEP-CTERM motif-containing protein
VNAGYLCGTSVALRPAGGETMARLAQIACAASLIVFAVTVPARADPINIVSGSLFMERPGGEYGPVNLVGTRGFTFTGEAGFYTGLGLFYQCGVPECPPGARVEFNLDLSGSSGAIGGVMTIQGDQYPVSDNLDAEANLFLRFDGSFVAPAMGPAHMTVSAPFSLTGEASAFNALGGFAHDDEVFGHGIGTVSLVPYNPEAGFPPSWVARSVRFDFAAPTPEPSTLLLVGTCMLVPMMRRIRWSRVSM